MTTYKFGVMSSVWTVDAPNDRIADAAALMFLRTDAPIAFYEPDKRMLAFALDNDVQGSLNAHFGGDFAAFLTEHRVGVIAATDSIRAAGERRG